MENEVIELAMSPYKNIDYTEDKRNSALENFKYYYEKYNKFFKKSSVYTYSFHSLLWDIFINEKYKDKKVCFYYLDFLVNDKIVQNLIIVIGNIKNYENTYIQFDENILYFGMDKLCDIIYTMNSNIFGLNVEETNNIIGSAIL